MKKLVRKKIARKVTARCSAPTHITHTRRTMTMAKFCSECGAKLDGSHDCTKPIGRAVVVTTAHRGVFFGYADKTDGETITLSRARLCTYWSADMKGFTGLASRGPSASCRIGEPADITLRNITAVLAVTPDAVKAWEGGPWSK